MRSLITKAKQFLWSYKQPLTKPPSKQFSPLSDLFLWRKGENWNTFFELTDIASFFFDSQGEFNVRSAKNSVRILLFDSAGIVINDKIINAPIYRRLQVNISELASNSLDQVGTFCILHSSTPAAISKLGSFLAERGYVSYSYCGSELRSYVHGNLDAVSIFAGAQVERLGGTSFFQREFSLQYELLESNTYEIAIVNPSTRNQDVFCEIIEIDPQLNRDKEFGSLSGRQIITDTMHIMLQSGGCHIFKVKPGAPKKRLRIRSRLVMARPLVFRLTEKSMDVFHG